MAFCLFIDTPWSARHTSAHAAKLKDDGGKEKLRQDAVVLLALEDLPVAFEGSTQWSHLLTKGEGFEY